MEKDERKRYNVKDRKKVISLSISEKMLEGTDAYAKEKNVSRATIIDAMIGYCLKGLESGEVTDADLGQLKLAA